MSFASEGSSIDFVGQQNIGENRSGTKFKFARLLIENTEARYIARQKIGRALNTRQLASHRLGQRLRQRRLSQPRQIVE